MTDQVQRGEARWRWRKWKNSCIMRSLIFLNKDTIDLDSTPSSTRKRKNKAKDELKTQLRWTDGREIHAHKLLCMRCLYFKAMFEGSLREATQRMIPIKNISYEVFHSLLEYCLLHRWTRTRWSWSGHFLESYFQFYRWWWIILRHQACGIIPRHNVFQRTA